MSPGTWCRLRTPPPPEAKPYFPRWATLSLHILFLVIIAGANLLVLSALKWIQQGAPERTALAAARHILRDSYRLLPSFAWIVMLQLVAIGVGFVLLIVPGFLAFVWLYFAQYALVLDGYRSWPALLYSRELMRKRFFRSRCALWSFWRCGRASIRGQAAYSLP